MSRAKVRMSALFAVPGRADEDGVLAGDRRDEQQADDLVLAEEAVLERAREAGEARRQLLVHLVGRDGHRSPDDRQPFSRAAVC